MTDIPELTYNKDGLIPVIVQDYRTNEVLMMAYSNEEAVRLMYETGYTHFWSRYDLGYNPSGSCVEQTGVACHTGTPSCFNKLVYGSTDDTAAILPELIRTIKDRKENPCDESYTCKLFNNETKMCKKIVEEAAEVVLAIKDRENDPDQTDLAGEVADLLYHTLVAVVKEDLDLGKVYSELSERH